MKKFESLAKYSRMGLEKEQMVLVTGGDCASGAGSITVGQGGPRETTITYSADTVHDDGAETYHTTNDKSDAPICGIDVKEFA